MRKQIIYVLRNSSNVIILERSDELKKKLIGLEKFPEVYERSILRRIK
jgi:hypothetical protein